MTKGREYLENIGYQAYISQAEATLKPCPFCGGQPEYSCGIHNGYDYENGRIRCQECGAEVYGVRLYGYGMYDPTKSFEAWNTRFELTCKKLPCELNIGDKYVEYRLKCSECEHLLEEVDNYCPNCGRKAVTGCTIDRVYLYDEEAVEGIECSKCGWSEIHDHDDPLPEICPNCKARVIEE